MKFLQRKSDTDIERLQNLGRSLTLRRQTLPWSAVLHRMPGCPRSLGLCSSPGERLHSTKLWGGSWGAWAGALLDAKRVNGGEGSVLEQHGFQEMVPDN